jgi:uncharacterized membrane protein
MQTVQTIDSGREESLRKVALMDYLLHIAGMLFSFATLSVVAVIINYIKRDDADGTIYRSHMNWQIRTFWWWLFWTALLVVFGVITLGLAWPLIVVPAIWFVYRMIKGLLRLNDRRAMPA